MKELDGGTVKIEGNKSMKKFGCGALGIGGIIGLIALALVFGIPTYNNFNGLEKNVEAQWAQVETAYQARADKTKNLVEIVKAAGDYEQETLIGVTKARAEASSMTLKIDDLTPENIAKYQQLQNNMSGALSRLLATFERYPDLKAVAAYRDFQAQYEGMENRISTERGRFNDMAREYNTAITNVPGLFIAKLTGFSEKGYFEADAGAEDAPDISFE